MSDHQRIDAQGNPIFLGTTATGFSAPVSLAGSTPTAPDSGNHPHHSLRAWPITSRRPCSKESGTASAFGRPTIGRRVDGDRIAGGNRAAGSPRIIPHSLWPPAHHMGGTSSRAPRSQVDVDCGSRVILTTQAGVADTRLVRRVRARFQAGHPRRRDWRGSAGDALAPTMCLAALTLPRLIMRRPSLRLREAVPPPERNFWGPVVRAKSALEKRLDAGAAAPFSQSPSATTLPALANGQTWLSSP